MLLKPMHLMERRHGLGMFVLLVFLLFPVWGLGAETKVAGGSHAARFSKIFAGMSFSLFSPSQSEFREIYKPIIVHPQIRVGYFFSPRVYIFSTFDFFSLNGKTPEWEMDTKLTQRIFSLGAGYRKEISGKISASGALSLVYLAYKEEIQTLAMENSSNCLGFSLEGAIYYKFSRKIKGITCLSYSVAQKTSDDVTAKFGGFRLGIGALFCF
jgi:hypothetical protein